jgi:hypothetical protein
MMPTRVFTTTSKAGKLLCALALFPLLLPAQLDTDRTAGGGLVSQPREKAAKNLISMDELNTLDKKLHQELDAAQAAEDSDKFADAGQQFSQLADEVDAELKRIAVASFPKNAMIEFDGVKRPVTTAVETEWFSRTRDKAQKGKDEAAVLNNVSGIQKQADDLLQAKKYPDDLETYKKAADVLGASKTKVRDDTYKFFLARSVNGERQAVTTYWSDEFGRLRDQYNKSTDDKLAPAQVREIIQGVMKEINDKGYLDPAKHPDMPQDARGLFQTLADAGNKYLSQFQ